MAKRGKVSKDMHWGLVWLLQALAMLVLGIMTALSLWLGGFVHGLFIWLLMPLGSAAACYICVCKGLNNYLALLAPPLMEMLGNLLIWSFLPKPGPILLCAFVSLIGSAAGEVSKQQQH